MKHPYLSILTLLGTSTTILAMMLAATVAATVAASTHARHRQAVTLSKGALNATSHTKLQATNLKLNTTPAETQATDSANSANSADTAVEPSPATELRPMMLQVTTPSGKTLKPVTPNLTKSSQAKPKLDGLDRPQDRLAQASQTVLLDRSGELTDDDEILESDNSRFDVYLIQGEANQAITIELSSNDFDTFLLLLGSDGQRIDQNDDISASNTNSFLSSTLPSSGTYLVVVNGLDSSSRGSYRVTASVSSGAPVAPTVTNFTCNGYSSCTVTEGDADYMTFSYTDANGNASEWTLNDFSAEIYPANGSGTIQPGIECTCPTGVGNCNVPATNTYTVAVRDTTNRVSNTRSVSVTCSP